MFYLGGPLSFLNGACNVHATCHYFFATDPVFANCVATTEIGEMVTVNYCGEKDEPLEDSGLFMLCTHPDCATRVALI
jgi:hypothetical protein